MVDELKHIVIMMAYIIIPTVLATLCNIGIDQLIDQDSDILVRFCCHYRS